MIEKIERTDVPHILSLGAGVQSSTIALMAERGLIKPYPTAAIFSDTCGEPESVYKWLEYLKAQVGYPIFCAKQGEGLTAESFEMRVSKKSGKRYWRNFVLFFTDDGTGKKGILRRKCTRDYKLAPLFRQAKGILGIKRATAKSVLAVSWIGISTDEIQRMKESPKPWLVNRWPLLEMRMSRSDCLEWMKVNGYPEPPRSACIYCPYHSNFEWRRLKTEEPEEFARAVAYEKKAQKAAIQCEVLNGTPYLHSSLKPLETIDFTSKEAKQHTFSFLDECDGMCGH